MDINNAFPSKYIKSSDLLGRKARVVVDRVEIESIGEDKRPIVYFRGKEKGLVLNKTNAGTISDMYGSNTDGWIGKEIILFPTRVDFKGERVDAIRIDYVPPPPVRQQPILPPSVVQGHNDHNPPPPSSPADYGSDGYPMNDEIPF